MLKPIDGSDITSFPPCVIYCDEDDPEMSIEIDVAVNQGFQDLANWIKESGEAGDGYSVEAVMIAALQAEGHDFEEDLFWDSENAAAVAVSENQSVIIAVARTAQLIASNKDKTVHAIEIARQNDLFME